MAGMGAAMSKRVAAGAAENRIALLAGLRVSARSASISSLAGDGHRPQVPLGLFKSFASNER